MILAGVLRDKDAAVWPALTPNSQIRQMTSAAELGSHGREKFSKFYKRRESTGDAMKGRHTRLACAADGHT